MIDEPPPSLEQRYYRLPGWARALIELAAICAFLAVGGIVVALFSVPA